MQTTKTILEELSPSNIYEKMRDILSRIPNKNNLYRKIGLNMTYLNLKNFIAGRDGIRPRSEETLNNHIGYKKVICYVREDENEEKLKVIKELNDKYFKTLEMFADEFSSDYRRYTKPSQQAVDQLNSDVQKLISGLTIDMDNPDKINDFEFGLDDEEFEYYSN